LRNINERIFGVLKKRFWILDTPPQYSFDLPQKLILVLCALHNFIRILANGKEDDFYIEADQDSTQDTDIPQGRPEPGLVSPLDGQVGGHPIELNQSNSAN